MGVSPLTIYTPPANGSLNTFFLNASKPRSTAFWREARASAWVLRLALRKDAASWPAAWAGSAAASRLDNASGSATRVLRDMRNIRPPRYLARNRVPSPFHRETESWKRSTTCAYNTTIRTGELKVHARTGWRVPAHAYGRRAALAQA